LLSSPSISCKRWNIYHNYSSLIETLLFDYTPCARWVIIFYYLNIPVWLYVRRINFHAPFNLYRLSGWVWKYIFVLSRGAITALAIAPARAPDARLATILWWLERTRGLSLLLFSYTNIKCMCNMSCKLT